MSQYAEKMQYRHPPIQERLVYSYLIYMCMIVNVHICSIYSAYIYMCVCIKCCFQRLPSCLIKISLRWGISWENLDGHSNHIYLVLKPLKKSGTAFYPYLLSPETPKTPKFLTHFRPSRAFHVLQICRICM